MDTRLTGRTAERVARSGGLGPCAPGLAGWGRVRRVLLVVQVVIVMWRHCMRTRFG
jgi:hypothetical protein